MSGPPSSPEYLPIRVAEAEGYFAAEGLAVTIRTTRAESGAAEALAQGQADLAATTLEAILRFGLRATNQAPRLIFGLTAAPPVALLVAGPHTSAVRSIEDLSALRVGVTTPGAPEHAWFGWLLARAGLSIAQVRVMSLGERGLVTAIDSGDVHVALVPEPMASQLLSQGRAKLLADFRTPRAAATVLGSSTVNAAVFARADRRPPVGPGEDGGVHRAGPEDRRRGARSPKVGEQLGSALTQELRGHRLGNERDVDVTRVDGGHEAALAEAHHAHLGDAEARAGQEPAEPGMLGRSRRRDAHTQRGEVLDRSDGAGVRAGHQQGDRGRGGQPEDEPRGLIGRPQTEAQDRLERRGGEIRLALGQRLGGAGFGPRRPDRDREPLRSEVALGLGNPDGKVLG